MLQVIETIAVIVAAIYGVILAARHKMDVVGVVAVAFLVAFGGGTLRDFCLDRTPLFWVRHEEYVAVVLGIAVVGSIVPGWFFRIKGLLRVPDAVGMALFAITGAAYAREAGTGMLTASILGVVTGTFGGVIGDVVCNEIPSLFRKSPMYASCAFAGAWLFLGLQYFGVEPLVATWGGAALIVVMRLAALKWDWCLPATNAEDES